MSCELSRGKERGTRTRTCLSCHVLSTVFQLHERERWVQLRDQEMSDAIAKIRYVSGRIVHT